MTPNSSRESSVAHGDPSYFDKPTAQLDDERAAPIIPVAE
jgi:hypothetical protein